MPVKSFLMEPDSKHEGLRVLVVDDDPVALAADCKILGGAEFAVLTATCGDDALRVARSARPAVIVLDVMLPGGKDGFTIFRELRGDPVTQSIPVIFLTGVNQATDLAFGAREIGRYLGTEPAAFLEKPVSAELLLRAIRAAASARTARAEKPDPPANG